MKISEASNSFINHIEILNYSPRTIELYNKYLIRFILFFNDSDLENLTIKDLFNYQRFLFRLKITPATQMTNLTVVRMLYRYLIRHQYIENDITTCIELPKLEKRLPKVILSMDEVKLMIEATSDKDVISFRDRIILEILYTSGIRVSELLSLTLTSINKSNLTIRVMGKGRRDNIIPISGRCLILVEEYIENYHPILLNKSKNPTLFSNTLILSYRGNSMNRGSVSEVLKRIAKKAGIEKEISPHTIRHSIATHLLKQGMGIRYIQEFLCHKNLATTEIYTQIENTDLINMVNKYHPLSNGYDLDV